jgi:hypothetical protein
VSQAYCCKQDALLAACCCLTSMTSSSRTSRVTLSCSVSISVMNSSELDCTLAWACGHQGVAWRELQRPHRFHQGLGPCFQLAPVA